MAGECQRHYNAYENIWFHKGKCSSSRNLIRALVEFVCSHMDVDIWIRFCEKLASNLYEFVNEVHANWIAYAVFSSRRVRNQNWISEFSHAIFSLWVFHSFFPCCCVTKNWTRNTCWKYCVSIDIRKLSNSLLFRNCVDFQIYEKRKYLLRSIHLFCFRMYSAGDVHAILATVLRKNGSLWWHSHRYRERGTISQFPNSYIQNMEREPRCKYYSMQQTRNNWPNVAHTWIFINLLKPTSIRIGCRQWRTPNTPISLHRMAFAHKSIFECSFGVSSSCSGCRWSHYNGK